MLLPRRSFIQLQVPLQAAYYQQSLPGRVYDTHNVSCIVWKINASFEMFGCERKGNENIMK